jgi:hypothetical protein
MKTSREDRKWRWCTRRADRRPDAKAIRAAQPLRARKESAHPLRSAPFAACESLGHGPC